MNVIYSNPDGTGFDTVQESPKYIAKDVQASFFQSRNTNFQWTSDFLATVDQNINKDFNIKFIGGLSYQDNKITGNSLGAGALFFPIYNVSIRTGDPSVNNYTAQARKLGILGDLTIGFRNYAFLHAAYRVDKDSRLSKDNQNIPYYSIDGSLVLSDLFPTIVCSFAKRCYDASSPACQHAARLSSQSFFAVVLESSVHLHAAAAASRVARRLLCGCASSRAQNAGS